MPPGFGRLFFCIGAPACGSFFTPKVGWNDLCPCGSGKKYKKCCGGAAVN